MWVLLHGFAGTGRSWDGVRSALGADGPEVLAPDLRGHGTAGAVRPVDFDAVVADVLAQAPGRFCLAGYSMGGRIAQLAALAAPGRVERLVLVATSAGLEDEAQRERRRAEDERRAERLESEGLDAFVAEWMALPLFAGTPPAARALWEEDLRRNEPAGLAAALRGLGAGRFGPLWEPLATLDVPATIVVGERDARYAQLGERLAQTLPRAEAPIVVRGAGHGLPREAPEALAATLRD
jgi:2-succinyl-6-hydroxy-2,4-cyclohexadiene-1-carboxylate synthase